MLCFKIKFEKYILSLSQTLKVKEVNEKKIYIVHAN